MLPLALISAIALVLPLSAQAAKFTYHGQMMDGDRPANGLYDLKVRAYASADRTQALGFATELPGVQFREGQFSVELDLPQDADGSTYIDVAVRAKGSGVAFETLGAAQLVTKGALACPGAWALDGNSGLPPGSYLGTPDNVPVSIASPAGVAVNSSGPILPSIDLQVHAKTGGDADADIGLQSRNNKSARVYVNDFSGALVLRSSSGDIFLSDGMPAADQNDGRAIVNATGRLRSQSVGTAASDTSGGLWLDDEAPLKSFVGRGTNDQNWTGIFAEGTWRMVSTDEGKLLLNTTTANTSDDLVVAPSTGADDDSDLSWKTRTGKAGTLFLKEFDGGFSWNAPDRSGIDFLSFSNGAHLTSGGIFTNSSSRALKEDFAAIDGSTWSSGTRSRRRRRA